MTHLGEHTFAMELIATITGSAAIMCIIALVGILWDIAERADEAS
jgi:hypothetical protein